MTANLSTAENSQVMTFKICQISDSRNIFEKKIDFLSRYAA